MTPMGSLHPVLFFAGIYVVALLFSIFICSTLFYSCNASSAKPALQQQTAPGTDLPQEAVAMNGR